ncbi:elongation factor 1-alpha C-terminal domain-related protein, partial [Francisella tularensis]|uniref:elongation factor 1-alpha C-terminal domain-related protein n=1 Tax=Francisella tularensis TaxID=263 RepID=UPI0023AD1856|nr:sulfate adenylyltransferase [Francisella tularensis subsp. holarctica]
KQVIGSVNKFNYKTDINTLKEEACGTLELNEIATIELKLSEPVCFDIYQKNRTTGAFIIIDLLTNVTAGAGMVIKPLSAND